jgi:hypothetical protein
MERQQDGCTWFVGRGQLMCYMPISQSNQQVLAVLFLVLFASGCGSTYRSSGQDHAYNEIVPDSVLEAASRLRPGQHIVAQLLTGESKSGIVVDSDYRRVVFGSPGCNHIVETPLDLHLVAQIEVLDCTHDLSELVIDCRENN